MRDVIMSDTNGAKLKGISSPTQVMVVVLEIWDNIVIHPKTTLKGEGAAVEGGFQSQLARVLG